MAINDVDSAIHFLVVDDDAESRSTLVEYLRIMGFNKVTLAHNGTEAIRLLDRDPSINFIISDWDMPMMNGLTLLQRVKHHPTRADIPFLVMTSPISDETEKVILAAENLVDGYLIKPFRSHVLFEKIQKVLTVASLGAHKQIIVVDDDEDARTMVEEYLKSMGFKKIIAFSEATEAIKYITQHSDQIGLIVSDWEMPNLNGIEFLKMCKKEKALADIPFLMVTSQSSIERMKVLQAAKANVDQYILKPFRGDDFKKRIARLIEKNRTAGEVKKLATQGHELLENGHFKNALTQFELALKLDAECDSALQGAAECSLKLKGPESSIPFFRKSLELNPYNPKTYIKLSKVYEKLGWWDKAIALLQNAKSQISFNADIHFYLGKLYSRRNSLDEAQREFETVLEIQLDHQEARLMLELVIMQKKGSGK